MGLPLGRRASSTRSRGSISAAAGDIENTLARRRRRVPTHAAIAFMAGIRVANAKETERVEAECEKAPYRLIDKTASPRLPPCPTRENALRAVFVQREFDHPRRRAIVAAPDDEREAVAGQQVATRAVDPAGNGGALRVRAADQPRQSVRVPRRGRAQPAPRRLDRREGHER